MTEPLIAIVFVIALTAVVLPDGLDLDHQHISLLGLHYSGHLGHYNIVANRRRDGFAVLHRIHHRLLREFENHWYWAMRPMVPPPGRRGHEGHTAIRGCGPSSPCDG